MTRFRSVLLTGASSGIGRSLSLALAGPGVTLHLSGRDPVRLAEVAGACRTRSAVVNETVVDVCDAEAMAAWINGAGTLDLVVANAGISAGTANGSPERAAQTRAIFATNLNGVLNTALPAMAIMAQQDPGADGVRGQIAVMASIAAFVAVPGAASYCASKAAVDAWTVAAARGARSRGVMLTSVCPGYVRTPMTKANRFRMPGLMDADRAATVILRGIAAGRVRVAFPWWMAAGARMVGLLPPRVSSALLAMQPGKASF